MDKVALLANSLKDAETFVESRGWTKVSLTFWKDEMGRLVRYCDKPEEIVRDIKLVIVTPLAHEADHYYPVLQRATAQDIPCKYE